VVQFNDFFTIRIGLRVLTAQTASSREPLMAAPSRKRELARTALLVFMAAFYYLAGILHFSMLEDFVAIVPTWVPAPRFMVIFTGWCEILGATGLLIPKLRKFAGFSLTIYAICVFPANIHMALDHIPFHGRAIGWDFNGPRLALEPILIWWPLFCVGLIDWPFHKSAAPPTTLAK